MSAARKTAAEIWGNPILVGAITILVVAIAVYLSYIAENGLPFVPTYHLNVDVTNANEVIKNADVRIGGARVGQVLTITPEPATSTTPHPYARLGLAVDRNLEPLPLDTRYQVRLASVLGGKYVEIIPGHRGTGGLPDGGTLSLSHDVPSVDLDTAFATFGPRTARGLRSVFGQFGDALAGRGAQLNDSIYSLSRLLGPLRNLMGVFADPRTRLSQFISGAGATAAAFAAVAPTFNALLADAGTTFGALQRSALGQTLDQLPPTETVATSVLSNAQPVLSDAAAIVRGLRPGTALLPRASQGLDAIVRTATPLWGKVPRLAAELQKATGAVDSLARDPAASQTFILLGSTDLATFGSSAFNGLGAILKSVAPAQFACNVLGLWAHNFISSLSEGDGTGSWLRVAPLLDINQTFEAATPASDLHLNYYPIENTTQCQAGNETYTGTQLIGNPPRTSTIVDNTTPPPGVLARGRKAGLVP
jgi:phospholipid/cholesterol/gamma-HCH transport system substrate-binding protein